MEQTSRLPQRPAFTWFGPALLLVILCSAGCLSPDVTGNRDIMAGVAECLPPDTPAPTLVARAIWFPHARGSAAVEAWNSGYGSGVLAWAGGQLWFMMWNEAEKHYDMECQLPVRDAAKVYLEHSLGSPILVIQSRNESFNSFELMGRGNLRADPAQMQAWLTALQTWRAQHPPPS